MIMNNTGTTRSSAKRLSKKQNQMSGAIFREKLSKLTDENTALIRENRNLWCENRDLKRILENANAKRDSVGEIGTKLLIALANFKGSGKGKITETQLIRLVKLPAAKCKRHFEDLKTRKFVNTDDATVEKPHSWHVTSHGRGYLVNRGLI